MPSNAPKATLTERGADSILDLTEKYVTAGLGDFRYAVTDLPGFLADTGPIVAAGQPTRQILRAACRSYARGSGPQNLPGFDAVWGGICEPYLQSINEDLGTGSVAPPFTGGQCAGVPYRLTGTVNYDILNCNSGETFPNSQAVSTEFRFIGPISSITPEYSGGSACGPNQLIFRVRHAGNPAGDTAFFISNPVNSINNASFSGSAEPASGPGTACGNPTPDYDPPNIPPGLPALPTTPVDFPGIGPIGIDVTFGPDGEINISLPDIGLDVSIDDPFGFNEGGDDDGPPPGFQGEPGTPTTANPGSAAEGGQIGKTLLGVKVETLSTPPRSNKIFNPTETYTKGAYFVYLGGDAGLALIDTAAITRPVQFFPAPPGSDRFRCVPNEGFTIRVTPYYDED